MEKLFDKIADGQWTLLCNRRESGLPHIQYLYAGYWRDDETGEIDLEKARRKVPELKDRLENDLLCIDVEGEIWAPRLTSWGDDPSEWQVGADRYIELIKVVREILPAVKLSAFAICPNLTTRHIAGYHAGGHWQSGPWPEYLNARRLVEFQRELAGHLDFYTPGVGFDWWTWTYARSPMRHFYFRDQWQQMSPTKERWDNALTVCLDVTRHGIGMCRDLLPPKPIIPSTSFQWDTPAEQRPLGMPAKGELVYPSWFRAVLDQLREIADSALIWSDVRRSKFEPEAFFGSEMWQSMI